MTVQPDAVSIAVPTIYHFETGKKCLEKGIHVLMEKPFASNLEQSEALLDLSIQKIFVFKLDIWNDSIQFLKNFRKVWRMKLPPKARKKTFPPVHRVYQDCTFRNGEPMSM